jgi:hypothetical protein
MTIEKYNERRRCVAKSARGAIVVTRWIRDTPTFRLLFADKTLTAKHVLADFVEFRSVFVLKCCSGTT